MKDLNNQNLLQQGSFINGEFVCSNDTFNVTNPANGQLLGKLYQVSADQLQQAVMSAKAAQHTWQQYSCAKKVAILQKWQQLILENIDDLALILTREQGKTINEAWAEISAGASFVRWFSEEAKRIYSAVGANRSIRMNVYKQPIGVVGAITAWGFPNAMITRKAAGALAAGCSFIVKPAEQTPMSALALAHLSKQAGFPNGLFNVVIGTDAQGIAKVLTTHPEVRHLTFSGATETAKLIAAQCATTLKKVTMELGGNAPFIVFADANLERAVEALMANKFSNSGQTCISANRVYVDKQVLAEFTALIANNVATLTVGNGENSQSDIGPLIDLTAANKVHNLVTIAKSQGAKALVGDEYVLENGCYYPPTVLVNVKHEMQITSQEILGPVLCILSFEDDDDVIAKANDTIYGLAAYFFTENYHRIIKVSEQLEYGMIGVNESAICNCSAPFDGIKQLGCGRQGAKYGIDEFLELKYVCLGGL